MFVLALLALIVSALVGVVAVLTWTNARAARRAAETSAAAATTSAEKAATSADAAQRSATVAEEQLSYTRQDRDARRAAARTPRFEMGAIDDRMGLVHSAAIRLVSREPSIARVEVAVEGAGGLSKRGGGVSGVPSLTWELPVVTEEYVIAFQKADRKDLAIIYLDCVLTDDDGGATRRLELRAETGAASTLAR